MFEEKEKLIALAKDLATGKIANYSHALKNDPEESLRSHLVKLMEFTAGSINTKEGRRAFRRNKTEIFEILEEVINETVNSTILTQFDNFVEYRNLSWGDENLFTTPSNDLFRVALVSDGNANIRRQNLREGQEFSVSLDTYAVKIGEELHRYLAGRVDWAGMFVKVGESFAKDLNERIYDSVLASYGRYNGQYHFAMNKAEAEEKLVELAMHIQARTGEAVDVFGTKLALRKIAPSAITPNMTDEKNSRGYYGEIAGLQLREIEQSHKAEKDSNGHDVFAIDNSMLLLIPRAVDKMVKVVNEGDAVIQDSNGGTTSDMMMEYFVANRLGIAVITSKAFGFVKIND